METTKWCGVEHFIVSERYQGGMFGVNLRKFLSPEVLSVDRFSTTRIKKASSSDPSNILPRIEFQHLADLWLVNYDECLLLPSHCFPGMVT
ncbi:hypothetical protein DTL21_26745 [Bremerella cremea]|uniref:Uncharacterized protein n=1 Tax=Blastopirellula marina TaxID=124 RepID=A0A2S8FBV6_9BACT|nr:hypothetical protein C5Y83_26700 [Blastopirellula marina]RCS42948.1 hypothetical protein DTL21_26745 [Bremerella cremea]